MFIGVYTIPVLITYLGLFCSFSSSLLAVNGNIKYAVILFTLAGIFDLFDGFAARKLNKKEKEKVFGIQIDSIIDVFSFGVTPIILAYNLGLNKFIDYPILFLYLSAATMRLAYFNYLVIDKKDDKPIKYYSGLPVTYGSVILPLVFLLKAALDNNIFINTIRLTYIAVALLFVFNIKIPKPRGVFYLIFPILTVIYAILCMAIL
jgi:CDP-diacylglycerol--serine O-phosphatidyltransferase